MRIWFGSCNEATAQTLQRRPTSTANWTNNLPTSVVLVLQSIWLKGLLNLLFLHNNILSCLRHRKDASFSAKMGALTVVHVARGFSAALVNSMMHVFVLRSGGDCTTKALCERLRAPDHDNSGNNLHNLLPEWCDGRQWCASPQRRVAGDCSSSLSIPFPVSSLLMLHNQPQIRDPSIVWRLL